MSESTKIEWCDYTFNPWIGCTKVAPGCANCYAEADFDHRRKRVKWGPNGTRVKTSDDYWRQPIKWNKAASLDHASRIGPTPRPRVFCASLADVFEDWHRPILNINGEPVVRPDLSPHHSRRGATMAELRREVFALIDRTPHLDWLLLTKRPENIRRMWPAVAINSQQQADDRNERGELFRRNVWLLTSVSDQATADAAIPKLLECRDLAPVLGVSAEPLLGPIDFWRDGAWCLPCRHCADQSPDYETNVIECRRCDSTGIGDEPGIDWVIVGGESGPHARPCNIDWVRGIRDQCKAAGVPCFVKQLGANTVDRNSTSAATFPDYVCWPDGFLQDGQRIKLRDPKGGDPAEWPEDLRERQFPIV